MTSKTQKRRRTSTKRQNRHMKKLLRTALVAACVGQALSAITGWIAYDYQRSTTVLIPACISSAMFVILAVVVYWARGKDA